MVGADVTMHENHLRRRRSRKKETNGVIAGARIYIEDVPLKYREKANLLVIYNTRLSLIVMWSLSWMVFSLLARGDVAGLATSLVWFIGSLFYFCGLFVTSKALTYITTHYRGYDDVDPDRVQFIEQMLRDMIDEIKQKELDIAAGAIETVEPTPEQNPEVVAKNLSKMGEAVTTSNTASQEKPQRV